MTTEQLRAAFETESFLPFVMHLADGRSVRVAHSEFALLSPSGRTMIVYQPDESWNVVDLLLVTDLEFSGNGHGKRRPGKRGA